MKKKITFTLPAEGVAGATEGLLLGDFNEWNIKEGIVMKKQKDGSLKATVALDSGKTYQYRYLLNDGRWENDFHAQQYVYANGYEVDNCVITVPEIVESDKTTKTAAPVLTRKAAKSKGKPAKSTKAKDPKPAASKVKTSKAKAAKAQTS